MRGFLYLSKGWGQKKKVYVVLSTTGLITVDGEKVEYERAEVRQAKLILRKQNVVVASFCGPSLEQWVRVLVSEEDRLLADFDTTYKSTNSAADILNVSPPRLHFLFSDRLCRAFSKL